MNAALGVLSDLSCKKLNGLLAGEGLRCARRAEVSGEGAKHSEPEAEVRRRAAKKQAYRFQINSIIFARNISFPTPPFSALSPCKFSRFIG